VGDDLDALAARARSWAARPMLTSEEADLFVACTKALPGLVDEVSRLRENLSIAKEVERNLRLRIKALTD
jgi:hypothetical protein